MCHCGLDQAYEDCCGQYHQGLAKPPTAEALMRSRYCAFVVQQIDYLEQTLYPTQRHDFDAESSLQWAKSSEWLGLEVLQTDKGQAEDTEGMVEYIAKFKNQGRQQQHHETGSFVKEDDQWYYMSGKMAVQATVKRDGEKIGRNAPCPCGSGKKYKKCCA